MTAPGCKRSVGGTAIASGDYIKVTGTEPVYTLNMLFAQFNLTPSSSSIVVVE